jgi:hypothetical protein
MKYYKNPINGEVFAYDVDGSQDDFITENLIPMSSAEIIAHLSPPEPTLEQRSNKVRLALQDAIDIKAQSIGFSGGNALMLYAGFENHYQPMAQVFATWEASVWVQADQYKTEVIAGTKPMLSEPEAVDLMPAYPED